LIEPFFPIENKSQSIEKKLMEVKLIEKRKCKTKLIKQKQQRIIVTIFSLLKKTQTIVTCENRNTNRMKKMKFKYFTWIEDVLQELICLSSNQKRRAESTDERRVCG
jgi:predicted RNA methylase